MKEQEIEAVVAGHICYDVIPAFRNREPISLQDVFVPGKLVNMGSVTMSTGGPVSNTGIALALLGINTKLMGKIGNDFFGQGVLHLLAQRHMDDGMIVVDGDDTSYTIVIAPPGCDRIFLHNPGASSTVLSGQYFLMQCCKCSETEWPETNGSSAASS